MIYSITFKNFCSFADKATISFEDIRKGVETQSDMFCNTPAGARLSKAMIAIGPNASGKTSALKALAFLRWFVPYSFIDLEGEKDSIPVDTFAFSEDKERISEFELVFEHRAKVYKYILHLCQTHVVKEELYHKEKTQHFKYLFKRNWNVQSESADIVQRIPNLKTEVLKEILRKNVSLLSAAVAIKNDFLAGIAEYWTRIISNVYRDGKAWHTSSLGEDRLFRAAKAYAKDKNLFNKALQFLKDMDLGLDGIAIEEGEDRNRKTGETTKIYLPYGVHKINEKEYRLRFPFEASGTKNMFALLHHLLPTIERGGIAVIDELEIDLHPHTLPKIIELFANPVVNPNNSQLLFTSHSLEVLNHLEKEQVILVEKKEGGRSELCRLDELKGVRRDDNVYAKYMAGVYGAVPNI